MAKQPRPRPRPPIRFDQNVAIISAVAGVASVAIAAVALKEQLEPNPPPAPTPTQVYVVPQEAIPLQPERQPPPKDEPAAREEHAPSPDAKVAGEADRRKAPPKPESLEEESPKTKLLKEPETELLRPAAAARQFVQAPSRSVAPEVAPEFTAKELAEAMKRAPRGSGEPVRTRDLDLESPSEKASGTKGPSELASIRDSALQGDTIINASPDMITAALGQNSIAKNSIGTVGQRKEDEKHWELAARTDIALYNAYLQAPRPFPPPLATLGVGGTARPRPEPKLIHLTPTDPTQLANQSGQLVEDRRRLRSGEVVGMKDGSVCVVRSVGSTSDGASVSLECIDRGQLIGLVTPKTPFGGAMTTGGVRESQTTIGGPK